MEKFDIDKEFDFYLKRVYGEMELSESQYREVRLAYYAGISQVSLYFYDKELYPHISDILESCRSFWKNQQRENNV